MRSRASVVSRWSLVVREGILLRPIKPLGQTESHCGISFPPFFPFLPHFPIIAGYGYAPSVRSEAKSLSRLIFLVKIRCYRLIKVIKINVQNISLYSFVNGDMQ